MTRPADDEIAAWRALDDAATPAPWVPVAGEAVTGFSGLGPLVALGDAGSAEIYGDAPIDGVLACEARNALPRLLDEIAALRAAASAVLDLDIGREPPGWTEAIAALRGVAS